MKIKTITSLLHSSNLLCPHSLSVTSDENEKFLLPLGPHFLVAGEYNSENTGIALGSILSIPKGRNLHRVIQDNNLYYISTRKQTYWVAHSNKNTGLLDFTITKGIFKG